MLWVTVMDFSKRFRCWWDEGYGQSHAGVDGDVFFLESNNSQPWEEATVGSWKFLGGFPTSVSAIFFWGGLKTLDEPMTSTFWSKDITGGFWTWRKVMASKGMKLWIIWGVSREPELSLEQWNNGHLVVCSFFLRDGELPSSIRIIIMKHETRIPIKQLAVFFFRASHGSPKNQRLDLSPKMKDEFDSVFRIGFSFGSSVTTSFEIRRFYMILRFSMNWHHPWAWVFSLAATFFSRRYSQ